MSHLKERSGKYRVVSSEESDAMPFCIDMAGVDCCTPNYYLKRIRSPISVMGFTVKGSGMICQNGIHTEARKGSLFLVNAGNSHTYYPVADWEFYWVNIRGDYWTEILTQYGLESQTVFPDFGLGQEFVNRICKATENDAELNPWQIDMQGFLFKTVLYLYERRQFPVRQTLAGQIKAEFEKSVLENATQEAVCKRLGMTVRHAQRVFKQEYGTSIHQFLSETKMRRAKALLMSTNSSIKQIAAETGFENEKYFSTFFHKQAGLSPLQYRMRCGYESKTGEEDQYEADSVSVRKNKA